MAKNNDQIEGSLSTTPAQQEQEIKLLNELTERLCDSLGRTDEHGYLVASPHDRSETSEEKTLRISIKKWHNVRKRNWTKSSEQSWDAILNACFDMELALRIADGLEKRSAQSLFRREWAHWNSESHLFTTHLKRQYKEVSVQVITIHRDSSWWIQPDLKNLLWEHPMFASLDLERDPPSTKDRFDSILEKVRNIEVEHDFEEVMCYLPEISEQGGPDGWAADCSSASKDLTIALNALGGSNGGFFDDEEVIGYEDLSWLETAKKGSRFWYLLICAIRLGRRLEYYDIFTGAKIEHALQKLIIGSMGKGTTSEGMAVETIIQNFLVASSQEKVRRPPTPTNLLKWLKGERPNNDGEPLVVDHKLWTQELHEISWDKFQNLVKAARRRIDESGKS